MDNFHKLSRLQLDLIKKNLQDKKNKNTSFVTSKCKKVKKLKSKN